MTSISSLSTTTTAMQSPRNRMNDKLSAAVASGEISATDQTALASALDSIGSSLEAERSSGSKPSGDMKSKMDTLIQNQVDNGTLTEDQASELKSMFAKGAHGKHGPHGSGGPEGAPPPQDADSDADSSTATASTAASTTAASASLDTVSLFVQQLREQAEDATSYSATGSTAKSSSSKSTGLVLDTQA